MDDDNIGMKDGQFLVWRRRNKERRTVRVDLSSVVRPAPEFKKPKGTTFKRDLKKFAVAHARVVQALLKEQGRLATNWNAAKVAAKNLQNDANYKDGHINFYKGYKNLKKAIEKELGQNRI